MHHDLLSSPVGRSRRFSKSVQKLSLGCSAALAITLCSASGAGASGFVQLTKENGRWWFKSPTGERFLSRGVCAVEPEGFRIHGSAVAPYGTAVRAKYENTNAWRKSAAERLLGWGFNTLGNWSDPLVAQGAPKGKKLYYTVALPFAGTAEGTEDDRMTWMLGNFPDIFAPEFEAHCRRIAKLHCSPRKDDPLLLGYYFDNELRWSADRRKNEELLITFLRARPQSPGRKVAVELLKERYKDIGAFNEMWGKQYKQWDDLLTGSLTGNPILDIPKEVVSSSDISKDLRVSEIWRDCQAFKRKAVDRYLSVTTDAVHAFDSNHLILGPRFSVFPGKEIMEGLVKKCDAVSVAIYQQVPDAPLSVYEDYPLPVVIGEFSFRAQDSGLPNTRGAGMLFPTQAERGAAFTEFVKRAIANPQVVGYHWFRWVDLPKEGRFDGENSNYGIVNVQDEPYEPLVQAMTKANKSPLPSAK
ncbi:agarase [Verrucomicrobiota bacterium sgz303538]